MNQSSLSAFRAIFWKEWRENVKWALLAALGLTLAIAMNVTQSNPGFQYSVKSFSDFWTLLSSTMTPGAMLTALLLGLLQVLPEQRRDQWAFLVHRPMSRTTLFWGKACAGLALYLIAVGAPFLGASLWAATPGHMAAPFDPRLMLAGAASVICGVNIYFAALLVAVRPARWYGSRILPLIAAAAMNFVLLLAHEFWQTLAGDLCVLAPLMLAARSGFTANMDGRQSGFAGRLGLSVTLFAGCFTVCMVVFYLVTMTFVSSSPSISRSPDDQYDILKSGQIVRATYVPKPGAVHESEISEIHDRNGHSLPASASELGPGFPLSFDVDRQPTPTWNASYASPWRYIQPITKTILPASRYRWFYSAMRRRVLVYSSESNQVVREIGADAGGRTASFPDHILTLPADDSINPDLFVFKRQIYRLNPDALSGDADSREYWAAAPLLKAPLHEDIVSVVSSSIVNANIQTVREYFICTAHSVTVADIHGNVMFQVPVKGGGPVSVTMLPEASRGGGERYFFWNWTSQEMANHGGEVTEYSSTGQIIRQTSLPSLGGQPPAFVSNAWIVVLDGAIVPALNPLIVSVHVFDPGNAMPIVVSLCYGAIWAALCWRAIRRAGLGGSAPAAGAVAGVILGLPALLTILSLYRWPAMAICPNCGRKRLVTQECCEYCGAAFAAPPQDGTEIFEAPGLVLHTEAA